MAGFKHRYLILRVVANSESTKALISNIKNILYKSIKLNFGDSALSLIDTFEVVESYENLNILILRCNLAIYKYLSYCIVSMGKINEIGVRITIENVSGICRRAKMKFVEFIKKTEKLKKLI